MERQHCHRYLKAEGEGCDLPHGSMTELRSPKSHRAVMLLNLKILGCFWFCWGGSCGVWGFFLVVVGSVLRKGPESHK